MKLLITGVHGFVGSNLVRAFKDEHEIYGIDIIAPQKQGVITTFNWDALDRAGALPEVDAIIHLAGKAHDVKNRAVEEEYFKVNTGLAVRIYDYFLASGAKKFIDFSSVKAAADSVEGLLTEDIEPKPIGPYGESKIKAEQYILSNMASPDKQVYIFRSCMIHGPGNKGNLNLLYSVVKKGIPWPLGSFDNLRTFSSIYNVSFVVNELLKQDVESGIYNMADDEALSTNELIELICESLGKKAIIWHLPKGLMTFGAQMGGWLHLPLNPERLRKLTENYCASNQKVKKAIGIKKMPYTAREGLRETLRSFVAQSPRS